MERYRSAAELIRREILLKPDSQILDVGCGNGYMKYFFDEHEGDWHGIEEWDQRVRCCQKLGYKVAEINIETSAFPYEDNRFDVVLASHVIEHLPEPAKAICECARVVKPGGVLLIATPTKPPILAGLLNLRHRLLKKRVGETQNAFSAPSLRRLVEKSLAANPAIRWQLIDQRGFRLISCRKRFKLENYYWFYRLNTLLARYAVYLTPEVNLLYKKGSAPWEQ